MGDFIITRPTVSDELTLMKRLAMTMTFQETFKRARTAVAPLNPNGAETPVFWVHSIIGSGTDPIKLSILLGSSRPFYSVRTPNELRTGQFGQSVSKMADYYISELVKVHPHGPLIIGAFSAGVVIALDMAHKLRSTGREVSQLVAVDFAPFNTHATQSLWINLIQAATFLFHWAWSEKSISSASRKVWRRAAGALKSLTYEHSSDGWSGRFALNNAETEFVRAFHDGVESYVPQQYEGPVLLYIARNRDQVKLGISSPSRRALVTRWSAVAPDLIIVDINGDHNSIIIGEDVSQLAGDLSMRLT